MCNTYRDLLYETLAFAALILVLYILKKCGLSILPDKLQTILSPREEPPPNNNP